MGSIKITLSNTQITHRIYPKHRRLCLRRSFGVTIFQNPSRPCTLLLLPMILSQLQELKNVRVPGLLNGPKTVDPFR